MTSAATLERLGFTTTNLDERHVRACPSDGDQSRCVCIEALDDCVPDKCLRFSTHVESFRRELKGVDGRGVACDSAEIGTCGDHFYFRFEGAIFRRETLWFDADERLVAVQEATDYRAYCDRSTLMRFQGDLPVCDKITRMEVLCGDAAHVSVPKEGLRLMARGRRYDQRTAP